MISKAFEAIAGVESSTLNKQSTITYSLPKTNIILPNYNNIFFSIIKLEYALLGPKCIYCVIKIKEYASLGPKRIYSFIDRDESFHGKTGGRGVWNL